jgi:hypothetical protein
MKKLIAIVLSLTLIATMGGVALAQSGVEPEEVNIVLPDGETANIKKAVTIGDVGTVDVWGVVSADEGLTVTLDPAVRPGVAANSTVSFTETIAIDSGGPKYATVTFYYGDDTTQTEIGKQTISVTEGDLDIKPGSFPNSINTKKKGVTPVALLGSSTFDVTTVDVTTLRFGPNDAEPAHDLTVLATYVFHLEDVNYDGEPDLVSHYRTKDTGIAVGQTSACLDYDLKTPVGVTTVCDSIRVIK